MDALKKAQQLRMKGSEGSPIIKYPYPDKKRGTVSKKQWVLSGAGFISLCIVLFILLRPTSPPLITQPDRAEKKEPTEGLPYVGAALSSRPSFVPVAEEIPQEPSTSTLPSPLPAPLRGARPGKEEGLGGSEPSLKEKREEPPTKQMAMENKAIKPMPPTKSTTERSLSPAPPATQKEETPKKTIGVEQEGGKDRALTSDILIHFNSGVSFYNQREFSKAIQAYQKVIELDPTYAEAYNNLGIIYQMVGDVDRAFRAYQKSTEVNPRYEKGYNNLGILLFFKGRYDEAQEAFQKALVINPNNIESHINLGILFKKKGEGEKAVASYQRALAINPLHREAHYNLALLYEQLENLELAVNHYQQFIQLSSKSHPDLVSKVQRHLNYLVEARRVKKN